MDREGQGKRGGDTLTKAQAKKQGKYMYRKI